MSDESGAETPPPPPPPPAGEPAPPAGEPAAPAGEPAFRPRLRRSRSERVLLGVSGGIARYFDVDPVIPRLVFVALTLAGGSGILLYLIAWLVIPDETEDETAAMNVLRGGRRRGGKLLLAAAGILVAILLLSGSFIWLPGVGDGIVLPLLIVAAGVALLLWPSDGSRWHREWHEANGWRDERDAVRDQMRRERAAWRESRRQWRHGYNRGVDTTPPGTPALDSPPSALVDDPTVGLAPGIAPPPPPGTPTAGAPAAPIPPRRAPRPRPLLGPLGFAAVLLFVGVSSFADAVGWWSTSPAEYLSGSLVIIGVVLVVSAFLGRARGLIWLGALLLPVAWAVTAVDLTWYDGIGEQTESPTTVDELDATYHWGIGRLEVDLSDLDLDGTTRPLDVALTIGEAVVFVPDSFATDIHLDGQLGSVVVDDQGLRANNDGNDVTMARTVGDPTGGTLELDVSVGIGEAKVIVCGGSVPCP